MNYSTSADILQAALFEAGEPIDGTSEYQGAALRLLNRVYQAIWMGGAEMDPTCNEEWLWLQSATPGVLTLSPVITGDATINNYDANILFNVAPMVNLQGRFIKFDDNSDVFRIASHIGVSTSATLDSVYTANDSTAATYKIYALEYDLPADCLRPISPLRVYRDQWSTILGISATELDRAFPLRKISSGTPAVFCQVSETRIRFSHGGSDQADDYTRVDFDYLKRPADLANDTGVPVLPIQRRKILADFVTYYLCVEKSDNKADAFGILGRAGLKAMANENRHRYAALGREPGHLSPRSSSTSSTPQSYVQSSGTWGGGIFGGGPY